MWSSQEQRGSCPVSRRTPCARTLIGATERANWAVGQEETHAQLARGQGMCHTHSGLWVSNGQMRGPGQGCRRRSTARRPAFPFTRTPTSRGFTVERRLLAHLLVGRWEGCQLSPRRRGSRRGLQKGGVSSEAPRIGAHPPHPPHPPAPGLRSGRQS